MVRVWFEATIEVLSRAVGVGYALYIHVQFIHKKYLCRLGCSFNIFSIKRPYSHFFLNECTIVVVHIQYYFEFGS